MNWEWDFGDNTNTTSSDFEPEYNYQNCNIDYTVTLTIWDQDSLCTDTHSDIAELDCLPEAILLQFLIALEIQYFYLEHLLQENLIK